MDLTIRRTFYDALRYGKLIVTYANEESLKNIQDLFLGVVLKNKNSILFFSRKIDSFIINAAHLFKM